MAKRPKTVALGKTHKKECSCGGLNATCFKCFGMGYYTVMEAQSGLLRPQQAVPSANSVSAAKKSSDQLGKAKGIKFQMSLGQVARKSTKIVNPASNGLLKGFAICPHCKCSLREVRLKRHLKRCPVVRAGKSFHISAIAPNSGHTVAQASCTPNKPRDNGSTTEKTPPHVEGSRGFSQFRDSGKFGSYPSFDSMDDESKP